MSSSKLLGRAARLSVDLDAGTVSSDGKRIPVTEHEHAVLELLLARLVRGGSTSTIRIGCLNVNLESGIVDIGGERLQLTRNEYSMLRFLALNKGRALSRDKLLHLLYQGRCEREPKIIDVYLSRLRQKLAQASGGQSFIETRRGEGYLLRDPDRRALETTFDPDASRPMVVCKEPEGH